MAEKKETTKKAGTAKKTPAKKKEPVKKKPASKKAAKPAAGQVNVYDLGGNVKGTVELPGVFGTPYRPDIIRKAVNASRSNRRQPYGPARMAGMRHAVAQLGKGRGAARVQRLTQGGHAAESPPNVGGRRAHPPTPEKDWSEKINKKEKALALKSAIAASGRLDIIRARGHRVTDELTYPIVVTDELEDLFDSISKEYGKKNERPAYTKETLKVLRAMGLGDELTRAKNGVHQRAGRGKMRGRRLKKPKSILFVVQDMNGARKCVGNLTGVDVTTPAMLNVEMLAPGGDPGRLTIYTEKALAILGGEADA